MISIVTKPAISLVKLAHNLVKEHVKSGDIAVDATVGNGHDTAFLLDLVAPDGMVYGFDIQQTAIDRVRDRLQAHYSFDCLVLFQGDHAKIANYLPPECSGNIKAVMFNLGYLPGGDKTVITRTESTLSALSSATDLLSIEGIITVVAYPGHQYGDTETENVRDWCLNLDPIRFHVNLYETSPENRSAPKLYSVKKLR